MSGLDAGSLDREITLQIATRSNDPVTNEEVLTWATVTDEVNASGMVDAQWLPSGTREAWQARTQIGSFIDGIYRIRDRTVRPTPDASRIIGHDGRTYDVKGVTEIGRSEGLEVVVVAHGE